MRIVLFVMLVVTTVIARGQPANSDYTVEALPFDKCEYREVIARLQAAMINQAGRSAEQSLAVLHEQDQLVAKAPLPDVPIGKQLTLEDSDKFSRLTQRLATLTMMQLMDSHRERDLRILLMWAQQIDAHNRWGTEPKGDNEEAAAWGLFVVARAMMNNKLTVTQPKPTCSIQTAIALLENDYIERLNKLRLQEPLDELRQLSQKYKVHPIARDSMSPADQETYDRITRLMSPAQQLQDAIYNYETLKVLATASELLYGWDKSDVIESAGDTSAVGRSATAFVRGKDPSEPLVIAIGVLRLLNERIPSEQVKQFEELNRRMKQANTMNKK